jgi:hypothetical protein
VPLQSSGGGTFTIDIVSKIEYNYPLVLLNRFTIAFGLFKASNSKAVVNDHMLWTSQKEGVIFNSQL